MFLSQLMTDKDNHLGTLTVTGTTIGTLSTGGVILNTKSIRNDAMTAINIGHAHLNGELATTITVLETLL